jgi:bifunctional NMN adenylyltransferase/nudix hydrolase
MADATVVIGRFSPYTVTQHAAMLNALQQPGSIAVVIGSAYHARTPRDPFTWQERQAMIELCVPEDALARIRFVPVRDYYDDARWAAAVERAVQAVLPETRRPQLVPTSTQNLECYAAWLPDWPQLEPEGPAVDDRALLRVLLSGDESVEQGIAPRRQPIETALAVVAPMVPPELLGYLRAWAKLPHYAEMVAEQRSNEEENAKWEGAPYPVIFTTVDSVVRAAGHVLLVRRKNRPGKGLWALPGGFLDPHERLLTSAIRELHEETSIGIPAETLKRRLKDVIVFDHPDRAMRARTITHAHYFELKDERLPQVEGSDDAAAAEWIPIASLPSMEDQLFEDHFHILDEFLEISGVRPQLT